MRLRNFVPLPSELMPSTGRQCKYGQCLARDIAYSICQSFGAFRQCSRSRSWVKLLLEILRAHRPRLEPCANHTTGLGSEIHEWMVSGENWIKIILRRSILRQCTERERTDDDRQMYLGINCLCFERCEIPDGRHLQNLIDSAE